jgi:hypothetical protein
MEKIKTKILDDTFNNWFRRNLEILLRVVLILHLHLGWLLLIFLFWHNLKVLLIRLSLF